MISSPTPFNALALALAALLLMAASTHALALATSQCLFKTANTSKLFAH
jgi:hypothetical protein